MSFTDTFTRADSAHLGGPWIEEPTPGPHAAGYFGIVSDQAVPNTYNNDGQIWTDIVGGGNGTYAITIQGLETTGFVGILVCRQDDMNQVLVEISDSQINAYEQIGGTFSLLGTVGNHYTTPGDIFSVDVEDGAITVKLNGITHIITSTTNVGTLFGMFAQQGSGGGGPTAISEYSFVPAVTSIVVDLETFHEIETFYGPQPLVPIVVDLETFHEIETFYGLTSGTPIVDDLKTFHEIEMFWPSVRQVFEFASPRTKMIETAFGFELGNVAFRRWKFHDPFTGETYHFEMNPNSMSTPYPTQSTVSAGRSPISGAIAAIRLTQPPIEWTFSGNIRTQSFQDALTYWFEKSNKIFLTDHIGRRWLVLPESFGPYPRPNKSTKGVHRWRYDAKVFCYGLGA